MRCTTAFNRPLYTFLLRLSRRRDVADDLLEENWLRLVKQRGRLRSDTLLVRWLFTVARNLYVSYLRSRLLEDSAMSSVIALWPCSVGTPLHSRRRAANELERRVERALASFRSRRAKCCFCLVAGLDPSDAADVCGVTPQTLRQRLHRAGRRSRRRWT
jgi:RNA polymerase sigma-70 factor (ECF subfamily)